MKRLAALLIALTLTGSPVAHTACLAWCSSGTMATSEALLSGLAARAIERAPTDHGYRLSFAPDSETLRLIATVIDAERRCCRWLSFTLTVASDDGPMVLTLSGPDGAREFLGALLNS